MTQTVHLWHLDRDAASWNRLPVDLAHAAEGLLGATGVALAATTLNGKSGVALVASAAAEVRVNGAPVLGGFAVLDDRDEITVGDMRWFLSVELRHEATVHRRAADRKPVRCVVCRVELADGDAVLRCGACGREYHHQPAAGEKLEKLCSTFRETCLCGAALALDAQSSWRPDQPEAVNV